MDEPINPTTKSKKPPSTGLTIFVVLGLPIVLLFVAVFWLLSIMIRG